ncbi:hypothetical protein LEP1GSC008_1864 [Leptospira kirschneri serovar Bulgarica str. Nikolaevo]|uniref:Uncharacterized protein n=1 Tax=Leptospira kirschneri serovar Bulgarica str. Nikolaevo TaxID=1240687 RepID=M6FRM1_9LEPT|nr:hypothetical protein LEP1GSC008_1864 [Leptospira kirschneri serovar Bulgarica str. Nikolaevo]
MRIDKQKEMGNKCFENLDGPFLNYVLTYKVLKTKKVF